MGITIHYKGKINSANLTDSFLEEVEDIAISMDWEYTTFPEANSDTQTVKGLFIKPHQNAESLQFMIDKEGHIRNAVLVEHLEEDIDSTYFNSIKTQFAPIEIHVAVVKLLKYLKQKYISNLEVWDEGDYWNTEDEKILLQKFDFLNSAMDKLEGIINNISFNEGDNAESVADKIEAILKQLWKKK